MRLNPRNPAAPLQPAYSRVATAAACLASLRVGHLCSALTCGDRFLILSSLSAAARGTACGEVGGCRLGLEALSARDWPAKAEADAMTN
jgi:hypothetical protein